MYERILVFAAHQDDEITMAGTIAKFVQQGTEVFVVNTTNGSEGYPRLDLKDKIVEMRRKEAAECDKILGIKERIIRDCDTQAALTFDKATLQEFMQIIRRVKPQAIFTHGPYDNHIDHRRTSEITSDAFWQAGQPVAVAVGEPWKTAHLFYYKGVKAGDLPKIDIDVMETFHKRFEASATQNSQFTLFKRKSKDDFYEEVEQIRKSGKPQKESFWIAARNTFDRFPEP